MSEQSDFERSKPSKKQSFAKEFIGFLGENKKWWLMPIVIVLVGFGALLLLAGTGAAPFIYTLF